MAWLTFYTVMKSRASRDFLDALSDERETVGRKAQAFWRVWRGGSQAPGERSQQAPHRESYRTTPLSQSDLFNASPAPSNAGANPARADAAAPLPCAPSRIRATVSATSRHASKSSDRG